MTQRLTGDFALERLESITSPHLHLLASTPGTAYEVSWYLATKGLGSRVLRGMQTQTVCGLFHEAAAALQFPAYFGHNWAAFDECLADLEWIPGTGYVILVVDALQLLAREEQSDLVTLLRSMANAAEGYAGPIARGESWDRPAWPFHVVLQEGSGNVAKLQARLRAIGASHSLLNREKM